MYPCSLTTKLPFSHLSSNGQILRTTFTGNFTNLHPTNCYWFLHTYFASKKKHFCFYKSTGLRVESNCIWPAPNSHFFPFGLVLCLMGKFLPNLSPLQHIRVLINPHSNFSSPQITQVATTTAAIRKMLTGVKGFGNPPFQNIRINFSLQLYSDFISPPVRLQSFIELSSKNKNKNKK